MKRLLLFLFILISFTTVAQTTFPTTGSIQFPTSNGVGYRGTGGDSLLWIPSDTLRPASSLNGRRHIAIISGVSYYWNGTKWAVLSGGGGSADTTSLSNRINLKLNISDTSAMLTNYVNGVGYALLKTGQTVRFDSATAAAYFLRRNDSATGTNLNGYLTRTYYNNNLKRFGVSGEDVLAGQDRHFRLPSAYDYVIYNHPSGAYSGGYMALYSGDATDSTLTYKFNTGPQGAERGNTSLYIDRFGGTLEYEAFGANHIISTVAALPDYVGLDFQDDANSAVGDLTIGPGYFEVSHNKRITLNKNSGGTIGNAFLDIDFTNHYNRLGDVSTQSYFEGRVDSLILALRSTSSKLIVNNMATGGAAADSVVVITSTGQLKKRNASAVGSGTVISVATNNGSGITGGTITTSGTIAADTTSVLSTKANVLSQLNGYTKQIDTISLASFGAGGGNAGDTTSFTTSTIYGSFYNDGSDTLVITSIRAVLQGSSPSLVPTVYYNDSINVTAGATKLVNSPSTLTNTAVGVSSTPDNSKIPPGVWVWVKTETVTTKPTYFTLTLIGYKKRK